MAKKSKTQRAKASARRAEKKELASQVEEVVELPAEEPKKESRFKKSSSSEKQESKKIEKKAEKKDDKKAPKKESWIARRFGFLKNVKAEMHRVTWPTRIDVMRWSAVVVVALVFFSVYVFVLDNWIVTPILMAISSLGA